MSIDINDFEESFNTAVVNSFNTDETNNTATIDVGVADSFNTDNSVTDSGNLGVDVDDSFHEDSHNLDVDVDDSGNTDSYNDSFSYTDSSWTDNSDHSVHDHSVSAGDRSYDTGFRDLNLAAGGAGAAGAGGGDLMIDNRSTIVDQSVNGNIASLGPVFQGSSAEAVVASGDESYAAGGDISVTTTLDESTTISSGEGDVNVGNTVDITSVSDSYNTTTIDLSYEDNSVDLDLDNVGNDYSETYTATDSFNEETNLFSSTEVDLDLDAIIGEDVTVVNDADIDF
ncbi:hypothetical protein [Microbacterium sp. Marseille-Q6965]|uniref:hypothetical protein n=1 Tax=Microbacterium sp. Marseille-Q6965 TaxID=2965072 RepID=UPI0021B74018|nr:hypothetical protein [Microbacterium sp. Marseille-Q6965]